MLHIEYHEKLPYVYLLKPKDIFHLIIAGNIVYETIIDYEREITHWALIKKDDSFEYVVGDKNLKSSLISLGYTS
jgi:hypothetical protein